FDFGTGWLDRDGAQGGPRALLTAPFFIGIDDLAVQPTQPPKVAPPSTSMTLFDAWSRRSHSSRERAIARGEASFDSTPIPITVGAGLNETLGMKSCQGTCTTCHNAPNIGNHSTAVPLNLGLTDASRRTPDLPLYTLRDNATGKTVETTDPGLALITGKWADIGKFKGPILRGLAARPPYFHNGSAANPDQVVDFYDTRLNTGPSPPDAAALVP